MKEEKLKELLERYYSGSSTLEEEMVLKNYFEGEAILPGYETERDIFCHFDAFETIPEPASDLELRIIESIDDYEKMGRRTFSGRWYLATSGIAALLLVTIGFYFFLKQNSEPRDTFSDPVIAYAETMKVLNEISVKLNKGTQALKPVSKLESAARLSIESIDRSAAIFSNSVKPFKNVSGLRDSNNMINK